MNMAVNILLGGAVLCGGFAIIAPSLLDVQLKKNQEQKFDEVAETLRNSPRPDVKYRPSTSKPASTSRTALPQTVEALSFDDAVSVCARNVKIGTNEELQEAAAREIETLLLQAMPTRSTQLVFFDGPAIETAQERANKAIIRHGKKLGSKMQARQYVKHMDWIFPQSLRCVVSST